MSPKSLMHWKRWSCFLLSRLQRSSFRRLTRGRCCCFLLNCISSFQVILQKPKLYSIVSLNKGFRRMLSLKTQLTPQSPTMLYKRVPRTSSLTQAILGLNLDRSLSIPSRWYRRLRSPLLGRLSLQVLRTREQLLLRFWYSTSNRMLWAEFPKNPYLNSKVNYTKTRSAASNSITTTKRTEPSNFN
jgi:hypothetical protein